MPVTSSVSMATRAWPKAERSAYQQALRLAADQSTVRTICGHCGDETTGPLAEARAWFRAHRCGT